MKRKRVIYYDDLEPALKKLKLLPEKDNETFLEEKKYLTFNMKEYKFEERKFGDISEEEDHVILFRENRMNSFQDQLQFSQYYMKNTDEFNNLVPKPPSTESRPKIFPKPNYSFSDYSKSNIEPGGLIKDLFGKDREEECKWEIVKSFEEGKNKDLSKAIFSEWSKKRSTFYGNHTTGNEANRRIYINDLLCLVVQNLKGGEESKYKYIRIKPEEVFKKSGDTEVGGAIDYVIVQDGHPDTQVLVVVEAKKGDIEEGLSQLIMETRSSYQRNSVKLEYVYGLVTNAKEWKPVRMNLNEFEEGTTCTISDAYSNQKEMCREIEKVIYVLQEMLKRGVEDYISKSNVQ